MTFSSFLAVASGGALGAVSRWGVARAVAAEGAEAFWGTALVNVAGSFGLGVASLLLAQRQGALALFVLVGFFGAFTTFSTFALDAAWLFRDRNLLAASAYVVGSVGLAVGGLIAGLGLGRALS